MANALCVEGDMPASTAYASTGKKVPSAAHLRVPAFQRNQGIRDRMRESRKKTVEATMPICRPDMARRCPMPTR